MAVFRKRSLDEILSLDTVLGLTTLSSSSLATSSVGDGIFYAAGSIAVRYLFDEDKQLGFFTASKAISCLAVSSDGRYLAVGERGHQPAVIIWDIIKMEKLVTLMGHKHGIGCLAFSPNGKYLVSVGFKHDRQLILWDWVTSRKLSTQKLGNKVHALSFHEDGEYFVTAGDRHLKWWVITEVLDGEAVGLEGKPASILEDQKNSVFLDIVVGSGNCDGQVFCTTSSGVLCVFNHERVVEKWVQLETKTSYALELFTAPGTPGLLVVGCANGLIRAFSPKTLEYLATLPTPAPLTSYEVDLYPAVYALRRLPGTESDPIPKLCSVYADKSLYVWDIADIFNVTSMRASNFHRSCIWDIQYLETPSIYLPPNAVLQQLPANKRPPASTFITCSADSSIRIWNADEPLVRQYQNQHSASPYPLANHLDTIDLIQDDVAASTSFLRESSSLLASTATGLSLTHGKGIVEFDFSFGIPDKEMPDRPQSAHSPRSMAVHPLAIQLACGDKSGALKIFDLLSPTKAIVKSIQAHSAEILTLAFSPVLVSYDDGNSWSARTESDEPSDPHARFLVLLATAGRDRLIHIFDATNDYSPIDTLDHHSSSVTSLRFTTDGKKLLSCGGDKTMVFNAVNGPIIQKIKSVQTPAGTINGLAVEASNKFVVTSGQDKRLTIWNVHNGKNMRAYKSADISTELYKTDLDPSGSYIATCAFDKTISLLDFFSGEIITQVTGHSELVTGLKFSPDGRHLVSIGGDGCIIIWKIAEYYVRTMKDRLHELYSNTQRRAAANKAQMTTSATTITGSEASSSYDNNGSSLPEPVVPPAASLSNLKQKLSRANSNTANSISSINSEQVRRNKWQDGIDRNAGYELFGKKVVPENHEKNKFTLEITDKTSLLNEKTMVSAPKPSTSGPITSPGPISSPINVASSAEDNDDVIQALPSDEEDEYLDIDDPLGKKTFTVYEPAASPHRPTAAHKSSEETEEDDEGLSKAQKKINNLEKSMHDLENWLETMLKNESQLDENVLLPEKLVSSDPITSQGQNEDHKPVDLGHSLSSAFFEGLKKNPPPLPPGSQSEPQPIPSDFSMRPPLPPNPHDTSSDMIEDESLYRTPSTASEDNELGFQTLTNKSNSTELVNKSQSLAQEIKLKTQQYKDILKELDQVKSKASQSFAELTQLRNELTTNNQQLQSTVKGSTHYLVTNQLVKESLNQADVLLDQFRTSLSSSLNINLPMGSQALPQNTTTMSSSTTSTSALESSHEVNVLLERYSDKLLDLLTEKMLTKLSSSSTTTSMLDRS